MSKEIEEWKPVVGYEGYYEVSDWGRVRSVERDVQVYSKLTNTYFILKIKNQIKCVQHDKDGYEQVNLKKNGKHSTKKVHRLVAEAFIPNPNNLPVVDHINGARNDNRSFNLRWCTQKDNLNAPLARRNNSISSKLRVLKQQRNNLGQFIS